MSNTEQYWKDILGIQEEYVIEEIPKRVLTTEHGDFTVVRLSPVTIAIKDLPTNVTNFDIVRITTTNENIFSSWDLTHAEIKHNSMFFDYYITLRQASFKDNSIIQVTLIAK